MTHSITTDERRARVATCETRACAHLAHDDFGTTDAETYALALPSAPAFALTVRVCADCEQFLWILLDQLYPTS